MGKRYIKLFTALLLGCWLMMGAVVSHASWAGMTIDEMWNKYEVVVGEITGEKGPVQGEMYNFTGWDVKVRYIIKGGTKNENLTVLTPDEHTSLHYNLDEGGRTVLLFISSLGDNWEPPSPQGVIPVELKEDLLAKAPVATGLDLMKGMSITGSGLSQQERDKLKDLIEHSLVSGPAAVEDETSVFDNIVSYVVIFLGIMILLGALVWSKSLRKKE